MDHFRPGPLRLLRSGRPRRGATSSAPGVPRTSQTSLILLGTAGLLSLGALSLGGGPSAQDAPAAPVVERQVITADLAARPPAADRDLELRPGGFASALPTRTAGVPTAAAAAVAPRRPSAAAALPPASAAHAPAGHAHRATLAGSTHPSQRPAPTPRPAVAAATWRDPGDSYERMGAFFLALAVVLGGFVVWLRRQQA